MAVKRWTEIKVKKLSAEELFRIDREVEEELSAVSPEGQGKEERCDLSKLPLRG